MRVGTEEKRLRAPCSERRAKRARATRVDPYRSSASRRRVFATLRMVDSICSPAGAALMTPFFCEGEYRGMSYRARMIRRGDEGARTAAVLSRTCCRSSSRFCRSCKRVAGMERAGRKKKQQKKQLGYCTSENERVGRSSAAGHRSSAASQPTSCLAFSMAFCSSSCSSRNASSSALVGKGPC